MSQRKKKQHYVWQHYLKGWTQKSKIWCRFEGRTFPVATFNVAHENDFYRLKELEAPDLALVNELINRMEPGLQEGARGWVRIFHEPFALRRAARLRGITTAAFEAAVDVEINNIEENIHAQIETEAVSLLDELRKGTLDFLADDERAVHFMRFISAQYMRTPGVQHRTVTEVGALLGANPERYWGLLRTILATNLGFVLYTLRNSVAFTFLDAPAEAEFITGDQPTINVVASDEIQVPPEKLVLYYPLAPRLAVLVRPDRKLGARTMERLALTTEEVLAYNRRIVGASYRQIYATSLVALSSL